MGKNVNKKNSGSLLSSIGGKIVTIFVLLIVAIVSVIAVVSVTLSGKALQHEAQNKFEALIDIKTTEVEAIMGNFQNDLALLAGRSKTLSLYEDLKQYHDGINTSATGSLDISTAEYHEIANGAARDILGNTVEAYGYGDMYIICWAHGHVMWSIEEASDLGGNVGSGDLKDTGLGEVWKNVTSTGGVAFSDFSKYSPEGGDVLSFFGMPLLDKSGKKVAVVAIELPVEMISNIMTTRAGMGETGETYLVGPDNLMRSDSYLDPINHSVEASFKNPDKGSVHTDMAIAALSGKKDTVIGLDYNGNPVLSSYSHIDFFGITWAILAEIDMAEVNIPINNLTLVIIVVAIISIILAIIIIVLFSKTITRPVLNAVSIANAMEANDLTVEVEAKYLKSKDETGLLANSLNSMKGSLSSIILDIADGIKNLTSSSTELSHVSDTMNVSVTDTNERTSNVASAVEEMNINMTNSAAGVEQASVNLNSVASAATEMSATIIEISKNTDKAKTVTDSAVVLTGKVSGNINTLGDSAKEIGNVTETISNISSQTNLLALNATIEAARAGAAGKGFAVVAGEIKDLAHQTATATEDIKTRILGIQDAVNMSIGDINTVSKVVGEVNDIVNAIAGAIEEQAITTRDITNNINEASTGIADTAKLVAESATVTTDISRDVTKVADATGDVARQGEKIVSNIADLNVLSERLQTIVDLFKV